MDLASLCPSLNTAVLLRKLELWSTSLPTRNGATGTTWLCHSAYMIWSLSSHNLSLSFSILKCGEIPWNSLIPIGKTGIYRNHHEIRSTLETQSHKGKKEQTKISWRIYVLYPNFPQVPCPIGPPIYFLEWGLAWNRKCHGTMTDYKGNVKGTLDNSDPLNKEKSI